MARKIGYCRVSTDDQETALQVDALERAGCDRIYRDEGKTGRTMSRPALQELLGDIEEGDTLTVWKLDRLGRSVVDLIRLLDDLRAQGVEFASVTEGIDTNTAGGRMFYAMLAAMAQYESEIISERTKAGQAAAKRRGKHIGRPSALTPYQLTEARKMHDKGQTMRDIARHFNVDYSAVRRACGRK